MNNRPRYSEGTMRNQIINLMHVSMIMTSRSYKLFQKPQRMADVMVLLRKEEVVERSHNKEAFDNMLLTTYEYNLDEYFYDNIEDDNIDYFEIYGRSDIKKAKYEKDDTQSKSSRIIKSGETIIFMYSAGVPTLPSEKKNIVQNGRITDNVYYQSREIKQYSGYMDDVNEEERAVITTRINGTLLTAGGNYNVYHIGKEIQMWAVQGEYKIKGYIEQMLSSYINRESCLLQSAILLTYDLNVFIKLIDPTRKLRARYEGLALTYENLYILPYDSNGRDMLKVMTEKDWVDRLKYYIMEEYPEDTRMLQVVCDYYDEEVYTLVFCIPDIKKYIDFIRKATIINDKKQFHIICFDYQLEFIKASAERYAAISVADFNEFRKNWFKTESNKE